MRTNFPLFNIKQSELYFARSTNFVWLSFVEPFHISRLSLGSEIYCANELAKLCRLFRQRVEWRAQVNKKYSFSFFLLHRIIEIVKRIENKTNNNNNSGIGSRKKASFDSIMRSFSTCNGNKYNSPITDGKDRKRKNRKIVISYHFNVWPNQ